MNHEHEDAHCRCPRTADFDSAGPAATGRRAFLRNAGLLGAGATAIASGTTVFGPAAPAAAADTAADYGNGAANPYDVTTIDTAEPGATWCPDPDSPVFTLVVMPDTQYLFDEDRIHPAPLEASFRHALRGDEDDNVVFLAHLGDITQNGQAREFAAVGAVFEMLDRENAAYSVLAGNHDVGSGSNDQRGTTPYLSTFPKSRAARSTTFGGASPDGYNTFHVFRAAGRQWLLLALDWRLSPAGFAWANKVIKDHPTLPVIVTTHELAWADDAGQAYLSDYGRQLWDGLIKGNDQVFLTLNGHYWPPGSATLTNAAGHDVHVHITNYQDRYYGGAAMIRTYRFDTRRDTIDVSTFSPWIQGLAAGRVNELAGQEIELTSAADRFSVPIDFDQRFAGFAPVPARPARSADKMMGRGTVAYWRFDSGADGSVVGDKQVIRDLTGRGNDLVKEIASGTTGNALTFSGEHHPDQPSRGSLRFTGQGDPTRGAWLQTVPNAPLNAAKFEHGYTFEAFFKLPANWDSSQNAWSALLSRRGMSGEAGKSGGNVDPQEPIATLSLSGGRELQWCVYPLNQSGSATNWGHELPLDKWWHVAVVNDGRLTRMYVDGCELVRNPSTPAIGLTTLNNSWLLGGYEYGGSINQVHNGWLGDVRITDRPLRVGEFMNA